MTSPGLTAEQLDRIIYKANLAPSPHNVQGWSFRWDGKTLAVLANQNCRIMRELDPEEKEGAIALGATIENIVLAAAEENLLAEVDWQPHAAAEQTVAAIRFAPSPGNPLPAERQALSGMIEKRCMNRSRYTGELIPPEQLATLRSLAAEEGLELVIVTDRKKIKEFARLAGEAGRFKFSHEPTHRELFHYLRFSKAEAARKQDGLSLEHFSIPGWLARIARVGMHWQSMRIFNRFGYHALLAYMQETLLINSAPAVCMLRSKDGERLGYLQAGRVLQRIWLAAARYDLAVQPHSAVADLTYARHAGYHSSIPAGWQQRIDSFPDRLRDIFSVEGDLHLVNVFRLGYPRRSWQRKSSRRPADETLAVSLPRNGAAEADAFYSELTKRNRFFINDGDQTLLRQRRIGVAGCGSIGGASLEVLVRMGAQRFLLAEPDHFELNNLNRQNATLDDLGQNKAFAIKKRVQQINPHVEATVLDQGLTPSNVPYFVANSAVIIDGVDVTDTRALHMKVMLHEEAYRQQKIVICGYDIAGTQLLRIYDYNKGKRQALNGKFRRVDLNTLSPLGFLTKVISPLDLPLEMLPVTRAMIDGELESIPQLGPTANLFGVLSAWAALDALADRPLRHKIRVDIPDLLRPPSNRWKVAIQRVVGIIRLKLYLNRRLRENKRAPLPASS